MGRRRRDQAGTDAITVRDGGQTGHIRIEQARECRSLRVAQLRELMGRRRDRAVVLTHLQNGGRALIHGGREAVGSEQLGEPVRTRLRIRDAFQVRTVTFFEFLGSSLRELIDGCRLHLTHEPHRTDGEIVVSLLEPAAARLRERVDAGGSASSGFGHGSEGGAIPGVDISSVLEGVEVLAHTRGGDPEPMRQLGGGRRPVHQEAAGDALAAALLEFHNYIVA